MTVKKEVRVVPEKQHISFIAKGGDGVELRADLPEYKQSPLRVYDEFNGKLFVQLYPNELDALIELLHAVKQHQAGPEPKRLTESDPALDIIAVEEPTA